jgi:hypothetical protein
MPFWRQRFVLVRKEQLRGSTGIRLFSLGSRDIPLRPLLPADLLRSDEFVPFKLEWKSLDDQPLLEK